MIRGGKGLWEHFQEQMKFINSASIREGIVVSVTANQSFVISLPAVDGSNERRNPINQKKKKNSKDTRNNELPIQLQAHKAFH